jgi:hypothetical protein
MDETFEIIKAGAPDGPPEQALPLCPFNPAEVEE